MFIISFMTSTVAVISSLISVVSSVILISSRSRCHLDLPYDLDLPHDIDLSHELLRDPGSTVISMD